MSQAVTVAGRDDALMARMSACESAALAEVITLYGQKAHRIAWRMLGEAAGAEDVAQEAIIKLWQSAGQWQPGGQGIGPWLARVTANLCIDRTRRIRPLTGVDLPEQVDESPGADALLDEERMRELTQAALQALPDRQRAAIVLTYWEECPNREAAAALELDIKAFESLLVRARKALRREIEARGLLGVESTP